MTSSFAPITPGPLLAELFAAQSYEESAIEYPAIAQIAEALVEHAHRLSAVVWPVGAGAERVTGAATLLSEGGLPIATWNRRLDGKRVLLFALFETTPLGLATAAAQVRSMGAAEVHACGVDVSGAADADTWDTYAALLIGDRARALRRSVGRPFAAATR